MALSPSVYSSNFSCDKANNFASALISVDVKSLYLTMYSKSVIDSFEFLKSLTVLIIVSTAFTVYK